MSYDPDFIIYVIYDNEMENLSNLVSNALPNAQQVSVSNIATSHNQIFINRNTLYDPTDDTSILSQYRFEIEVIFMKQVPITNEVMQKQASIAQLLVEALSKEDIKSKLISHDLTEFMEG